MKFNFFHLMPYPDYDKLPHEWPVSTHGIDSTRIQALYNEYLDEMVDAENYGFDWVGCNEHHFSPYGLMSNPNLIAGALARQTSKAKIAIVGNLLPLLNPVRVAEEYAMIDVMSGGRLVAGFLRGIPHEYIAYNIPPSESRSRLREATELIIKCWTEDEPFGWEGEHYQFPTISIWPKPIQKPHPRILMSASNAESAEFVAKMRAIMGITLIQDLSIAKAAIENFKKTARSYGWEPTPDDILVGQQICIADTDEEAKHHMAAAQTYFHQTLMRPQRSAQQLVLGQSRYYTEADAGENFQKRLATLRGRTVEEQIEAGSIICGSPQSVIRQIKRLRQELDCGLLNLTIKVGNMPGSVVRRGMELFRDRVAPEVAGL
ncbi:LLM class flavin-dependent oxidoreductase [Neorhizobium galegae]|uniref:LLM class flavin-dependent oxidoreductase n=1 Tax=Neorhizobium galegae TaxID=399 RepID=UPI0006216A55|nr:LLM class flavin-dependent oxidoreductase [Neorhizobium galegae]CDZ56765.1 Luciferase-like, subgroup [Neorhizobium galegae bv. orientalis]KAB1122828.1 LLM class flavin-dependent oxidoreductase [Neorhizobium galegae]MCQ1570191.1 LLM class flavin-dependent oxidoreductase [Neorhizobium galegae]MCQ1807725.1 LLM class flavin-dependent oxidoreductase [Neorhizobium galegae]CDZ64067.1 Luciferase-like, subgroup [Neorhizobium galegae bv. orientalis]